MSKISKVLKYICISNSFYKVPFYIIKAVFFQLYKRIIGGVFSHKLPNGKQCLIFPKNPASSVVVYSELPERYPINFLRSLASKETVFLDIGANIGLYSLLLADKVDKIFAFEAHPKTAKLCKMNFLLNNIGEENVYTTAICDRSGTITLSDAPDGDPTNHITDSRESSLTVAATTLDAFIEQQNFGKDTPFILKIDVEGFEHLVFAGATNFLEKYAIQAIIFETFSEQIKHWKEVLQQKGYYLKYLGDHNMVAIKG